ncbi:MAG: thermonuclease family protein [Thermodesulfobacteriota bacterium]
MPFKRVLPTILTTALLFFTCSSTLYAWQGKVIKVTDGDTIEALRSGQPVKVRLYGIDTPEKSQWYGQNAKTFTSAQVMGKKVEVEPVDTDGYGRTVGIVSIGNLNLSRHLVE